MASYLEDHDAIAAFEDEDDYVMVFTSAPSTSSHGAGAAATSFSSSSSSSPDVDAEEEEEQMPPAPLIPSAAASPACHEHDMAEMATAAAEVDAAPAHVRAAVAAPPPPPRGAPSNNGGDDEVTDGEEDEDDYMSHYDRADRGRSRHVKRSSGRRGRTKKASTMGRPRGGHLSHVAGAL
ncbi:hypothetical protein SETIT_3G061400v2 [Setaria italica]|uniref:Uncharacterized protein n=1 Tax=Setaria italica TaxID=4555 RepID=A0A368QC47_SETIT|nr:hypothetical protein SETIT_3G061400v2 [Setaria italica]